MTAGRIILPQCSEVAGWVTGQQEHVACKTCNNNARGVLLRQTKFHQHRKMNARTTTVVIMTLAICKNELITHRHINYNIDYRPVINEDSRQKPRHGLACERCCSLTLKISKLRTKHSHACYITANNEHVDSFALVLMKGHRWIYGDPRYLQQTFWCRCRSHLHQFR